MRMVAMCGLLAVLMSMSFPLWSRLLPGGELDDRNREYARLTAAAQIEVPRNDRANAEYLAMVPRVE